MCLESFSADAGVIEQSVKLYMLHLCASPTISHATVKRRKAAISSFLGMAKLPNPFDSKYLNELISRELAEEEKYSRGRQAAPLTSDLLEIINTRIKPDNLLDSRDLALVNVMYDALLRSDEATKVKIGDINRRDLTIFVPATKSDQTGKGSFRYLSKTSVQLIDAYLGLAQLTVSSSLNFKQLSKANLFRGLSPKKTSILESQITNHKSHIQLYTVPFNDYLDWPSLMSTLVPILLG
jgi:integrase